MLNAIFYVLWTGCQWKALPKDLPPKSTVYDYLDLWNWDGTLERIHHVLYVAVREQAGREASPTTAIIDSQSAKGALKGGLCSMLQATTRARRSRAVSGISSSTHLGLLLNVVVLPADIQDRDGAFELLRRARRLFPFIERIFADGGYQRREDGTRRRAHRVHGSSRSSSASDAAKGFEVLPKRWIVERTFAWISRCRRLARDFERFARTTVAFVRLSMIRIMLRRLAANPSS